MSKYSFTIFSPKGRLTQVDFAKNTLLTSNPVLGVKSKYFFDFFSI